MSRQFHVSFLKWSAENPAYTEEGPSAKQRKNLLPKVSQVKSSWTMQWKCSIRLLEGLIVLVEVLKASYETLLELLQVFLCSLTLGTAILKGFRTFLWTQNQAMLSSWVLAGACRTLAELFHLKLCRFPAGQAEVLDFVQVQQSPGDPLDICQKSCSSCRSSNGLTDQHLECFPKFL